MKPPTKRQKYVVVADWGAEKTFEFYPDEGKALDAGHDAENQGADVVVAEVWRLRINARTVSK